MKLFNSAKRASKKEKQDSASKPLPKDKAQSSRLMNTIASHFGFEDYLEVGVQGGITFNAVEIARKDAVDPNFLFETAEFETEAVRFIETTSDDFFSTRCDKTYDLIFLDGLHTFEQCLRDLCAALQVLNEGGVIVIDDTVPGDFFSSLATQDLAISAREEHGLSGRAWTGDVFKVVLVLHKFFPNLRYMTLRNPNNPAYKPNTVVWRAKCEDFNPTGMTLTEIESLGYFDLPRIQPLFRFTDYEPGLSILFDSVKKQV